MNIRIFWRGFLSLTKRRGESLFMNDQYIIKARTSVRYGDISQEPILIILMGLPGSGKSYLADYLNRKYSFTILSGENVTHTIFGTEKCTGKQYKEAYDTLRTL